MEEYVVGSVAGLLSSKKGSDVKAKKSKIKTQEVVEENKVTKKSYRFFSSELMSENKKKDSEGMNLLKQKNIHGFPRKDKKYSTVESNSENKVPKKRKKSIETIQNAEKIENAPKPKKQKKDLSSVNVKEGKTKAKTKKNQDEKEKLIRTERDPQDLYKNTVFIGNIPISYDKKKICKIFSKYGEILNARIRCVPIAEINMKKKVAAIKKKFNPKRNSLVAYVRYKSEDSANAALGADGMVVDGHHLRVDTAEENKERDNNKAVFVGGLPFDIKEDELWGFFENCGQIKSVRVIRDSQTSMGKGFGYVNFESSASVELALQLDGQELNKRTINVKRCVKVKSKNKPNSFDKKKSKDVTMKLLNKKGNKFKEEKNKLKKENKLPSNFQGRTANMKPKKRKKLSQTALRQKKLVKILGK